MLKDKRMILACGNSTSGKTYFCKSHSPCLSLDLLFDYDNLRLDHDKLINVISEPQFDNSDIFYMDSYCLTEDPELNLIKQYFLECDYSITQIDAVFIFHDSIKLMLSSQLERWSKVWFSSCENICELEEIVKQRLHTSIFANQEIERFLIEGKQKNVISNIAYVSRDSNLKYTVKDKQYFDDFINKSWRFLYGNN